MVSAGERSSFTEVGPGTPAADWRARPEWGNGEPLDLEGVSRLVVLAAHPDDETLGAGGLVATASRLGLAVEIVCATDGEGSHPRSPTRTPEELAVIRAEEGRRAAQALGVASEHVHRVGLADGGVAAQQDALTARLVEVVGDGRGTVVVAPWREDGHPDHEATGRSASAAAFRTGADLWEYPLWFWHWGTPGEAPWSRFRPFGLEAESLQAKQYAIHAHKSQVAPLSAQEGDETLLPPELLANFDHGPEHFVRTASADCVDDSLDRLHTEHVDPWGVESRWFEQRKRDLVLAMLPRPGFERTIEVGCSTGALAEALARRSGHVLAVDSSPAAVAAATRRFRDDDRVTVERLDVPADWPQDETFDLVVVSELGYFMSPGGLEALVDRIASTLGPTGVVVLCHWRHPIEGWVLDADAVHAGFESSRLPGLRATYRDDDVEIRVHARRTEWPDPGE